MNRDSSSEPAVRPTEDGCLCKARFLGVTIFVALTLSALLAGCNRKEALFLSSSKCPPAALSRQSIACDIVDIDAAALEKAEQLSVKLPEEEMITIQRTAVVRPDAHALIWRGKVDGAGFSNATFSVVNKAVVGTVVTTDGRMYRLRRTPEGSRIFERLESKAYRVRDAALKPPTQKPPTKALRRTSAACAVDHLNCATNDRRMAPLHETSLEAPGFEQLGARSYQVGGATQEPQLKDLRRVSTACGAQPPTCGTDSADRIDVMVVYTPAALSEAGGEADMAAWINKAEDETNVSYSQSGVLHRINILRRWTKEVAYVEQDLSSDLDALIDRCDDVMDYVHDWRNDAGADLVVLITHIASFGSGGYAYTLHHSELGSSQLFEHKAFAVVEQEHFTAPAYVFAHELGHLMGAQHDEKSSPGRQGAFDFSHGHVDPTPTSPCTDSWMTIMAEASCCTPIGYWSAPKTPADTCGKPMGAAAEDNAKTLNETASTVANFRCSHPMPGNVQ